MTVMYRKHRVAAGFSLVEMMVAMTIGVLILLAVSEVFISNNRSFTELEKTSRQIENGRYAMQLLESELANAGFFGESLGAGFPDTLPPACLAESGDVEQAVEDSIGVPVFGVNELEADSAEVPGCLSDYSSIPSGYLVVRRSSTCDVEDAGCAEGFSSGEYYLRVSACAQSNPGSVTLARPSSISAMPDVWGKGCSAAGVLAPTYKYLNRIYYVRDDATLMRVELQNPFSSQKYSVTPLVDGIEFLHFEYGLDSDGDGAVDEFDAAPSAAEWEDVVAVRIWLLARNTDITPNYTDSRTYQIPGLDDYRPEDGFKRQLYTSTVRLNNVAGRREVPASTDAAGTDTNESASGSSDSAGQ